MVCVVSEGRGESNPEAVVKQTTQSRLFPPRSYYLYQRARTGGIGRASASS